MNEYAYRNFEVIVWSIFFVKLKKVCQFNDRASVFTETASAAGFTTI